MLEINHVSKTFFPSTEREIKSLIDISISIKQGDFCTIVGGNGSGKSTFLNMIAGTLFPDQGNIMLDSLNITSFPDFQRSKWIVRVFQDPLLGTAGELTVIENFRLAALRTDKRSLFKRISQNFEAQVKDEISKLGLGLENKIYNPMGNLSGGQRQALTLVMAGMSEAKILLLDEPTAALDPKTAYILMELAQKLIKDKKLTAFFITHDLKKAFQYGNRLLFFQSGKIVKDFNQEEKNIISVSEMSEWFE